MSLFTQFRRYVTVGAGSAVTDLCAYALLTRVLDVEPLLANLISRPMGGIFSFVCNKLWTFRRNQFAGTKGELIRFWCAWLAAYAASEALIWLFYDRFSLGPLPAKLCAEAIVCSCIFFTHRYWTFRGR